MLIKSNTNFAHQRMFNLTLSGTDIKVGNRAFRHSFDSHAQSLQNFLMQKETCNNFFTCIASEQSSAQPGLKLCDVRMCHNMPLFQV